jgi:V/A-type H+-transporting ATPase subunit A
VKAREMLAAFLDFHAQAGRAIGRGVPLRAVLDTGLGARLLGLGRTPASVVEGTCAGLRREVEAALAALEAE